MCGFVIKTLKYEKKKKKEKKKLRERKKTTLATAKYTKPNCFCLWFDDYRASILANHRPGSWKSLKILDCF